MLSWLISNIWTIIITVVIAVLAFLAVRRMIQTRKSGCCSECGDCPMKTGCKDKNQKGENKNGA